VKRTLSILAVLVALGSSTVARADNSPEALAEGRSRFQRGVEFYKEGDFRAALIEFKRAYDAAPNYKVLYNIAQTSLELQDYATALKNFEKFLADGGADVPAARRAQIVEEMDRLGKRVARVAVEVNVTGAEVLVDDVSVGKAPLSEPIVVSAGRRRLTATFDGKSTTRVIDVAGGDTPKISLLLETHPLPPTDLPTPTPTPRPAPDDGGGSSHTGAYVGLGITGALTVATVVTGVVALGAKSSFDDTLARRGATPQDVDDARTRTRTFALVTDVLGGSAIVAGAVTLIVALTGKSAPKKEHASFVQVGVSPWGVDVQGRF